MTDALYITAGNMLIKQNDTPSLFLKQDRAAPERSNLNLALLDVNCSYILLRRRSFSQFAPQTSSKKTIKNLSSSTQVPFTHTQLQFLISSIFSSYKKPKCSSQQFRYFEVLVLETKIFSGFCTFRLIWTIRLFN